MKRIKLIFAWYDFWIGLFWDSKKKLLYIFPIPMIGLCINCKRVKTTYTIQVPDGYEVIYAPFTRTYRLRIKE